MEYCENCQSVHFPNQCRQADWNRAIEALQNLWNAYNGFAAATSKYAAQVYAPVSDKDPAGVYDGYADNRADPKLCLHCQPAERVVGHIHGCDGNGCQCPTCNQDTGLLSILTEESNRWDWLERWGLAYRDKKRE